MLYTEPFFGIGIILGDFVVRYFKSKGLLIEVMRKWYRLGSFVSQQKDSVKF